MSSGARHAAWAGIVVVALVACSSGRDNAVGARENDPAPEARTTTIQPPTAA